MLYEDGFKHKALRRALVEQLEQKGIKQPAVLAAIGKIPRHVFLDSALLEHAYQDKALGIGEGQTISQPYTVAFQTELLETFEGAKVLEIGTGSGYQAAVLLELGCRLSTIEYNAKLHTKAKATLAKLHYKAHFVLGDGSQGYEPLAPYDRILVTCGAPVIPSSLLDQLNIGGILVIPVGDRQSQKMLKIKKISSNSIQKSEHDSFAFVPMLGKNGWNL